MSDFPLLFQQVTEIWNKYLYDHYQVLAQARNQQIDLLGKLLETDTGLGEWTFSMGSLSSYITCTPWYTIFWGVEAYSTVFRTYYWVCAWGGRGVTAGRAQGTNVVGVEPTLVSYEASALLPVLSLCTLSLRGLCSSFYLSLSPLGDALLGTKEILGMLGKYQISAFQEANKGEISREKESVGPL